MNISQAVTLGTTMCAGTSNVTIVLNHAEQKLPIGERVEQWFIAPLMRLQEHDGFVCLMLCFPLLEKVIRHVEAANETDKFSLPSKLLSRLASSLNCTECEALAFWQIFRNGLQHRSTTKEYQGWTWEFFFTPGAPVRFGTKHVFLNPWTFRDLVVDLVRKNPLAWDDKNYPLARVFVRQ